MRVTGWTLRWQRWTHFMETNTDQQLTALGRVLVHAGEWVQADDLRGIQCQYTPLTEQIAFAIRVADYADGERPDFKRTISRR